MSQDIVRYIDIYCNILITAAILGSKLNVSPLGSDEMTFCHIHMMGYQASFDNNMLGY